MEKVTTYARSNAVDARQEQLKICHDYLTLRGAEPDIELCDNHDTYPAALEDIVTNGAENPDDPLSHLIIPKIRTLSDSWRDAVDLVAEFIEHNVEVHAVEDGVKFRDENDVEILRLIAEVERGKIAERIAVSEAVRWGKHTGRPPLGFSTDDRGRLRPATEDDDRADTFEKTSKALREVVNRDTSIKTAASRLNCSRTTIKAAIRQRSEMYDGLDEDATLPSNPTRSRR